MLNEKQKNLVEENYKLIYKYAKEHKLDLEEFSGLLSIGLCKAALNYDEDKTKFSTFAFKCMGNEVGNYLRKINAAKYLRHDTVYSMEVLDEEDNRPIAETSLMVSSENIEREYIFKTKFQKEYSKLKDQVKNIVALKYRGYTNNEVAEIMDMKASTVSMALKKFKMALV
jgi:RNA polymerase sigma factor (sigma-70 family)